MTAPALLRRLAVLAAALAALAALPALAAATPTPTTPTGFFDGNIRDCRDIGLLPGFAGSGTWRGAGKSPWGSGGSFSFGGDGVTIQITNQGVVDGQLRFAWSSNVPIGVLVVKQGNGGAYYDFRAAPQTSGLIGSYKPDGSQSGGISHASFCYTPTLAVAKTAQPAFERVYDWSIDKAVDVDAHTLEAGGSATSAYTLTVDKQAAQDRAWRVTGTITVKNLSDTSTTVTSVADAVSGGIAGVVDCNPGLAGDQAGPFQLMPWATLECTYRASLPNGDLRTNTATASSGTVGVTGGAATVPFSFAGVQPTLINDSVAITDTYAGSGSPWTRSADAVLKYERTFRCGESATYPNTARVLGDDPSTPAVETAHQLDSDSASVDVTCQQKTPPPTVLVRKLVVNDDGGTKTASDFSVTVGGVTKAFVEGADPLRGEASFTVDPGDFTVTESTVAGYAASYSGDCQGKLGSGDAAVCEIRNDDRPGTIVVRKTVVNDDGGTATASDFSAHVGQQAKAFVEGQSPLSGETSFAVGAGPYTVTESGAEGYAASFGEGCEGTVANGQTVICSITNDDAKSPPPPPPPAPPSPPPAPPKTDSAPQIDLAVVKTDAPDPAKVNGTLVYTLTVTNGGPATATDVHVADPAPTGIAYLAATTSQGSCELSAALVSCSLGSLASGGRAVVTIQARPSRTGRIVNTATVTGTGEDTNPGNNTSSATTLVVAPATPPTPKPTPKPKPPVRTPAICSAVKVQQKLLRATGAKQRITVRVTAAGKPVRGARVLVKGPGIARSVVTKRSGFAVIAVKPSRPGIVTVSITGKRGCNTQRIGIVGVFEPPVTG